MKAFWVQMIELDLFFRYLTGHCHGNQFCKKMTNFPFCRSGIPKWNVISLPQCALNCLIDASISCKNFVNFGPVTPELTKLICERLVRHGQKAGIFSRISPDILYYIYRVRQKKVAPKVFLPFSRQLFGLLSNFFYKFIY